MTHTSEHAAQQIRERGFRLTAQRELILDVLRASPGHLAPTEIHRRARARMRGITASTVYRNLDFLARNAMIYASARPGGHPTYELAQDEHHHIVCRGCGAEAPLEAARVARFARGVERATGFLIASPHMTLSGLCPRCQKKGV